MREDPEESVYEPAHTQMGSISPFWEYETYGKPRKPARKFPFGFALPEPPKKRKPKKR